MIKTKKKTKNCKNRGNTTKLGTGKYNESYKFIKINISSKYLKREGREESWKLITRTRYQNLEDGNKYWLDREKGCVLPDRHFIEECAGIVKKPIQIENTVLRRIYKAGMVERHGKEEE